MATMFTRTIKTARLTLTIANMEKMEFETVERVLLNPIDDANALNQQIKDEFGYTAFKVVKKEISTDIYEISLADLMKYGHKKELKEKTE